MQVDVIVIGTGQAGAPLATRFAREGRRVVVFERALVGGTCVNYGCTPTKTLIASAQAAHEARRAGDLGVRVGRVEVDLAAVVDRKEAMVREWRSGVEKGLENAGERLTLVREHARFAGPGVVEAGGDRWTAERVILNTGARPAVPDIPGLDEVPWLDNASLMGLREIPDHLVVLGGGYIGCELGQAFRRFGAEVTIVDRNAHLLSREDPEVSEALEEAFRDEGIRLVFEAEARRVAADPDGGVRVVLSNDTTVRGSHLLLAVGRRPNTDDLGCEEGGIERDGRGAVVVDDRYRTSAEGVYAVGDVTGGPQFTHASWDDHRILFDLLHGDGRRTRADRLVPYAVFTDPQVSRVGLSEREARERGVAHEVARLPFGRISRAREVGREAGVIKVLVEPDTERLLGAAVVGAEAGELIHLVSLLMQAGAPARALVDAEMVHPAFAEGIQSAVMRLDRYAL